MREIMGDWFLALAVIGAMALALFAGGSIATLGLHDSDAQVAKQADQHDSEGPAPHSRIVEYVIKR